MDIFETYKSTVFANLWECRNKEGQMIGCGSSAIKAELDTNTYDSETMESYGTLNYLAVAELMLQ